MNDVSAPPSDRTLPYTRYCLATWSMSARNLASVNRDVGFPRAMSPSAMPRMSTSFTA
jgi:hypothetical protein